MSESTTNAALEALDSIVTLADGLSTELPVTANRILQRAATIREHLEQQGERLTGWADCYEDDDGRYCFFEERTERVDNSERPAILLLPRRHEEAP